MDINYKKYVRAVIAVLVILILTKELPHMSKPMIRLLIPDIRAGVNGRFYPSTLLIVGVPIWAYFEIIKSNVFYRRGKLLVFVVMFVFVIPLASSGLDYMTRPYYLMQNSVASLEIVKSEVSLTSDTNSELNINMEITVTNLGRNYEAFQVVLKTPDSIQKLIDSDNISFPDTYHLAGDGSNITIEYVFTAPFKEGMNVDDISAIGLSYDEYEFVLFNESAEVLIKSSYN